MSEETKSTLIYMVSCFVFGLIVCLIVGLTPLWAVIGAIVTALFCGFGMHFEDVWFPKFMGEPSAEQKEKDYKLMREAVIWDHVELEKFIDKVLSSYPEIKHMDVTHKETHKIIYAKIFQDYGKMVANIKMIKKVLRRRNK